MCLAIPARVTQIDAAHENAVVAVGEVEKEISLALVDSVNVGDYVLVHVGYALHKLSEDEAQKTLQLFAQAGWLETNA